MPHGMVWDGILLRLCLDPVLGLPPLGHSELSLLGVTPCLAVPAVPVAAHTSRDPPPGGQTAKNLGQSGDGTWLQHSYPSLISSSQTPEDAGDPHVHI